MMGKQAFVDLLIVLVIPALILGAYFTWFRSAETVAVLSPTAWQDKSQVAASQPGTKTELALKTLKSIHLDDSLFKDPAYLSLKTYTINIPSVPVSRPFPFTPPPAVSERLRDAHYSGKSPAATNVASSGTKIDALGISNKINLLKGK